MKAIVFTTDALFALVIAAMAISVLLFFRYTPQAPLTNSYSQTQLLMDVLLSTHSGAIPNSSTISNSISYEATASGAIWVQYGSNSSRDSATTSGPLTSSLLFKLSTSTSITAQPVAAYGDVFFATGNTITAINASTATLIWNRSVQTTVKSLGIYNNIIVYSNSTAIGGLFVDSGKTLWSYISNPTSISTATTPILLNQLNIVLFGSAGNTIEGISTNTGTFDGNSLLLSYSPLSMTELSVPEAIQSTANGLGVVEANSMQSISFWYETTTPANTPVASYNNTILFGSNSNACGYHIDGTVAFCQPAGNTVIGVTVVNGNFIYQTTNSIIDLSTTNTILWQSNVSSSYGTGIGQAIASHGAVYTEWSNSYILAQNASTGSIIWATAEPYGTLGQMILAYGRLYVVAGKNLLAYGVCNANAQSSILDSAVNLYVNGDGSCGTALLNGISPLTNYSVFLNNSILPGERLAHFNGQNSFIQTPLTFPSGSSLPSNFNFTVDVWVYTTGTCSYSGTSYYCGIIDSDNGATKGWGLTAGANTADFWVPGAGGAAYDHEFTIPANAWTNIAVTYTTSCTIAFVNGINVPFVLNTQLHGASSINLPLPYSLEIGRARQANTATFNGFISDLQLYNTSLSSSQISQIYKSGITGPPAYNSKLVAWWPLDGEANDYSGNGNTGYPTNVMYLYTGYSPPSLINSFEISKASAVLPASLFVANFNGQQSSALNSYISNTLTFPISSTQSNFTVSAWVYTSGTCGLSTFYCGIIDSDNGAAGWGLMAGQTTADFWIQNTGSATQDMTFGIPKNNWTDIVVTYQNIGGSYYSNGYVNGNIEASSIKRSAITLPLPYPLEIGRARQSSGFNGLIANVQIYNTTLSQQQVSQLFREGIGGFPVQQPKLVAWYPLNGNANDYAKGNNGQQHNLNYSSITTLYNTGVYTWK
jgi:hypothetical protein